MDRMYVKRSISEYNRTSQYNIRGPCRPLRTVLRIQRIHTPPTRTTVKTIDPIQSNNDQTLLLTLFWWPVSLWRNSRFCRSCPSLRALYSFFIWTAWA